MLTEGLQDYIEAVLICEKEHGCVRMKHIACRLGVRTPSVNAAVKELARLGLVSHESYGLVELTASGRQTARSVYKRHQMLRRFFSETLALPDNLAEKTACGIEHHLDERTAARMTRFMRFLDSQSEKHPGFAKELREALIDE
ncbi:MAG: metal-dependent transcriptional regulator [Vicinamibacteria bacterium]|nr:metal-dependent transcriptional regulator [Vicinamibacteria bacterium]